MSKAFTKEGNGEEELDSELPDLGKLLPPGTKNYITPQGAARLRGELQQLLDVARPEVVRVVSWAASNGDRSENADYIYGKRRLREIDRRIRFLTKRLDAAEVIDPETQKSEKVLFGATVKVQDSSGVEKEYSIVGIDETDAKRGRISWISPVGKALLRSKAGDSITVRTPGGDEELEVTQVRYIALP